MKKMLKELQICFEMQFISLFLDITKGADFWWRNADVNRTQGVCQVLYMFFGSSLGKT